MAEVTTPFLDEFGILGVDFKLQDTQAREDIAVIQPALAKKANIDGYYQDAGVGTAEQLIASVYAEDQVPYVFRPSGGSGDVGNRMFDEIVGGSLNWNQLIMNGNFEDTNHWRSAAGSISASGNVLELTPTYNEGEYAVVNANDTDQPVPGTAKHKYLVSLSVKSDKWATSGNQLIVTICGMWWINTAANENPLTESTWVNLSAIKTVPDSVVYVRPNIRKYYEADKTPLYVKDFICIDLTALFGPTIADYIYTLETSTPGAGVAYFRRYFPKNYYPYKAVTMEHMQVSAHETVEFNQWDEEWEAGSYSRDTGLPTTDASRIRTKNPIPVIGGMTYYIKSTEIIGIWYYDGNDNFIPDGYELTRQNSISTAPANACFLRFSVVGTTTYHNDICINFHKDGTRDGEYEPYKKHTYALDPVVLRGIPKKDTDGNLYFDGDIYSSDGTVTRRYAKDTISIDSIYAPTSGANVNPNVDWGIFTVSEIFNLSYGMFAGGMVIRNPNYNFANTNITGVVLAYSSSNKQMCVSVPKGSTVAEAKGLFDGINILYGMASPTTEEATSFQNPQIVSNWGTERYVDASYEDGDRDFEFPAGHYTQYMQNLRDKLQHLPNLAEADGTYAVSQTGRQMGLVSFGAAVDESAPVTTLKGKVPDCPVTNDGKFVLTATVASGGVSYAWEVMA